MRHVTKICFTSLLESTLYLVESLNDRSLGCSTNIHKTRSSMLRLKSDCHHFPGKQPYMIFHACKYTPCHERVRFRCRMINLGQILVNATAAACSGKVEGTSTDCLAMFLLKQKWGISLAVIDWGEMGDETYFRFVLSKTKKISRQQRRHSVCIKKVLLTTSNTYDLVYM